MNELAELEKAVADALPDVTKNVRDILDALFVAKHAGVDERFLDRARVAVDHLIEASAALQQASPCRHAVASNCPHYT